jgi:hypothetical protein
MQIVKAGVVYFALVFGAGFLLGPIRIFWVVPSLGAQLAELLEMPIMLVVMVVAARWTVRRFALPHTVYDRVGVGGLALALLLIAEFGLVLSLRGMTISDYFSTFDPVSGTAYFMMQGLFAMMPLFVSRR